MGFWRSIWTFGLTTGLAACHRSADMRDSGPSPETGNGGAADAHHEAAPAESTSNQHIDRLAHVAKIWGTIRWLHPYIFDTEVDWDEALVAALPKINSASTPDEYAAAVDRMLSTLHDPLTHVLAS